jgi:hypothetical protein
MTKIQAVNVCPNGKLGHLVMLEPRFECLNCKYKEEENNDPRT